MKTYGEIEAENYPLECRFVIRFTSYHKTTRGGIVSQGNRRFRLADNAESALESVLAEIARTHDGVNNRADNVTVTPCPEAAVWVGYNRFGGAEDIRKAAIQKAGCA